MKIHGTGGETYLLLNGIATSRALTLAEGIELQPTTCSPTPDSIITAAKSEADVGVAAIFLRSVKSQLRVVSSSPETLAVRAWNALWDAVLLSAFCDCEAVCNFQCDTPADRFGAESHLMVTNYHLRGLTSADPHVIDSSEAMWLEANFATARTLLSIPQYQDAVHALASYRWHPRPRVQMAVLWAGVEGLFGVDSEVVFRLSLYAARFLEPLRADVRAHVFTEVRRLYKQRSVAVHGGVMRGDQATLVAESADLLRRLLRRCVSAGAIPDASKLAP